MARLSPDDRRDHLLDAGQAVFAEKPFEAVSMAALARAAGVSKGLVYHYFGDKQAFYDAVLTRVAVAVVEVVRLDDAGPLAVVGRDALTRFVAYVHAHAPFYGALVRGAGEHGRSEPTVVERVRWAFVEQLLARPELAGRAGGERLRQQLYGWVGLVEFRVLVHLRTPAMADDVLVDDLLRSLLFLLEDA